MVNTGFAEPKVREPLRIEVIPAGSDTPVLVRERGQTEFKPTKGGELVHRRPGMQRPTNTPPIQANKPVGVTIDIIPGWKTKTPTRPPTTVRNVGGGVGDTRAAESAIALVVGNALVGAIDEVLDVDRDETFRKNPLYQDPTNVKFYDLGRGATEQLEDIFDDAGKFYKDLWDNRPDVEFPSLDPRDVELPKFELPKIELPKLDLPELDLPSLPKVNFPDIDFNPFNQAERDRENERLERNERKKQERENRTYNEPNNNRVNRMIRDLPDGCSIELNFIQHRTLSYPNPHITSTYTATDWMPGPGEALLERSSQDEYGNIYDLYVDYSGTAGYPMIDYPFDITLESYTREAPVTTRQEYRQAVHFGIYNDMSVDDLFKFREEDGGGKLIDISEWKLVGIYVYCSRRPPIAPYYPPLAPLDSSNPPEPPEPKEPMDCCSCSDIARVFQSTLQRLRYNITVPVVTCTLIEETWTPVVEYKTLEIFALNEATATAQAELYLQLATQSQANCDAKNAVNKISTAIGVDEYPAKLPESLISKDEGFLGNLIPNKEKEIPNLTQLIGWYIERFDEIMGQWEVPIEIKDSDPTEPGEQPVGVKLPNIAETLGEIFTLAFQANLNSETLLNFAVRTAGEAAADKQQNFITYKLLESLTEYMGYKQKNIKVKMPLLYTLGKEKYDEILKESEVEVPCVDFDEKFGIQADLMRVREAIAILEANYKRKIDPSLNIKEQIARHLLDALTTVNKVEGDEDDDMEQFIDQVERGFGDVAGVSDPTRPYGRDFTERPRIRDLTKGDPKIEQ